MSIVSRMKRIYTFYSVCLVAVLTSLCLFAVTSEAKCFQPGPPYPPPTLRKDNILLKCLFDELEDNLSTHVSPRISEAGAKFSIEITSAEETLWSFHNSVPVTDSHGSYDEHLYDARIVNKHTVYRMASVTKVFTVFGILLAEEKGLLDLDDPVSNYLNELRAGVDVQWSKISLRSLASQLSGIHRESLLMISRAWGSDAQKLNATDSVKLGYPPLFADDIPSCGNVGKPFQCSRKEMLEEIASQMPLYTPNFKSTYSNVAYILLGLVLEEVTGMLYNEIMQRWIFDPLGMSDASIEKPDDSKGAIVGEGSYWATNLHHYNATGAMYSSTDSLSIFLRHVLAKPLLLNSWLKPASYNPGGSSAYGMPWEVFRSPRFLPNHANRQVTFYTKSGNLPGYATIIMLLPEQGIGLSILTAGPQSVFAWVRERVTEILIPGLEDIALHQMEAQYAGTYRADPSFSNLNSSITLKVSRERGLYIERWISNSTNFLEYYERSRNEIQPRPAPTGYFYTKLIPNLLDIPISRFQNDGQRISSRVGVESEAPQTTAEAWRAKFAPVADENVLLWDDFCLEDVEDPDYGGFDLNEFRFEMRDPSDLMKTTFPTANALNIPALRIRLERVGDASLDGTANGHMHVDGLHYQKVLTGRN